MRAEDVITRYEEDMRARVLIAEDDAELRFLLQHVLEQDGYRVMTVSDGEALRKIVEGSPPGSTDIDVVISDIRMPGYSGLQVLELLRQRDAGLPVILISAFADDEACAEARRLGAANILSKPFDPAELRGALRALVPPVV